MNVEGRTLAHIGSMELGLKPIIRITGSPNWRSWEASSFVKIICSPPNLYAFLISVLSTTRAVSSAVRVVSPVAICAFSPPR